MSNLTQKSFPLFMQSVFSATTEKIRNIMSPQSVLNGVIDYVSLVEDISQLTYETAKKSVSEIFLTNTRLCRTSLITGFFYDDDRI